MDLIGQRLGQYEIIGLLGRGGMATVYRAQQLNIKREVAVKVIKPGLANTSDFMQRFEREAQTIASLSHPHILKLFDYGKHADTIYLVMELLTGGSLDGVIRKNGALAFDVAAQMLDQIASALDYAHRRGIVHRDLKPQNVLLDENGNAFLTDFGIAKLISENTGGLTQTGTVMGTPSYMSPEQWQSEPLDARSDVYSLGVILFEMLTGSLPFHSDTPYGLMYLHVNEAPPPIRTIKPEMPPQFDEIIAKAMAKNRDDRFISAGALATAFKATLTKASSSGLPTTVASTEPAKGTTVDVQAATVVEVGMPAKTPETTISSQPQPRRMNPFLIGGIGILALIVIGGIILAASSKSTPTSTPLALVSSPSPSSTITASIPVVAATTLASSSPTLSPTPSATLVLPTSTSTVDLQVLLQQTVDRRNTLTATVQIGQTQIVAAQQTGIAVALTSTANVIASYTKTPTPIPTVSPSLTQTSTTIPTAVSTIGVAPTVTSTGSSGVGGRIVFSANSNLYTIFADGTGLKQIVQGSGDAANTCNYPIWSPNGKTILFSANFENPQSLYTVTADGGALTRLIKDKTDNYGGAYSPDGKQIVFSTTRTGTVSGLYIMNSDGTNTRKLVIASGHDAYSPVWSPDGKQIAFVSSPHTTDFSIGADLVVMNADGSNLHTIVKGKVQTNRPAWSPDGSLLLYSSFKDVTTTLYETTVDGSSQKPLVAGYGATWSPDGLQIAYISTTSSDTEIVVINADGSNPHRITSPGGVFGTSFDFDSVSSLSWSS